MDVGCTWLKDDALLSGCASAELVQSVQSLRAELKGLATKAICARRND